MGPGKWAQHHPNPESLQNAHEVVGGKERELHTCSPMGAMGRGLSVVYRQDHHLGLFAACFQASLLPLNCHQAGAAILSVEMGFSTSCQDST